MRRGWISVAASVAVLAFGGEALAQPGSMTTQELSGTVGTHAVGASLTITDAQHFTSGHYFYTSQLKDIPLTGIEDGDKLILTEPGGGVFHLTLKGNGSNGANPLTFENSVGLVGTWTGGGKSLPVDLEMDSSLPGAPSDHRYADVTTESDSAYEARVHRWLTAVLTANKAEAAALTSYPLSVNYGRPKIFHTKAQLIAAWDQVFTPAMLTALRAAVPHEMFVRNGQAMVAGGAAWFDAKGVMAINEP